MRRLPDNLDRDEAAMRTCLYSMFSDKQCPKALAWMAALCAAAGRGGDAEQWLVELISAVVFAESQRDPMNAQREPMQRRHVTGPS
jgi:hypothetical protein